MGANLELALPREATLVKDWRKGMWTSPAPPHPASGVRLEDK